MLFSKLLPRDGNFFEKINLHAQCSVAAARAFSLLVSNYADHSLRKQYTLEVDEAERRADDLTHDVNVALHKTFITPIDREHIHKLISSMDDVVDTLRDSAETMALYDIQHITPEIARLTEICLSCCERMEQAVTLLHRLQKPDAVQQALRLCAEIDKLESDADHVLRAAISRLFREEPDVRELIKLKAIYELLESVTDCCEDVAVLIEGVLLENS